jgi:GNAT superfamily N-acetyltransferase
MSRQDGITFRLADPRDALQLADLRWRLKTSDSSDYSVTERNDFVAAFAAVSESASGRQDEPFFHWVADLKGRLIAVMSVRKVLKVPSPERLDGCWGYLTNCYALPDYRNRGIGTHLLSAIKEWAKEQELELLVVWPSDRSYAFYERSGFHRDPDPLVLKIQDS